MYYDGASCRPIETVCVRLSRNENRPALSVTSGYLVGHFRIRVTDLSHIHLAATAPHSPLAAICVWSILYITYFVIALIDSRTILSMFPLLPPYLSSSISSGYFLHLPSTHLPLSIFFSLSFSLFQMSSFWEPPPALFETWKEFLFSLWNPFFVTSTYDIRMLDSFFDELWWQLLSTIKGILNKYLKGKKKNL